MSTPPGQGTLCPWCLVTLRSGLSAPGPGVSNHEHNTSHGGHAGRPRLSSEARPGARVTAEPRSRAQESAPCSGPRATVQQVAQGPCAEVGHERAAGAAQGRLCLPWPGWRAGTVSRPSAVASSFETAPSAGPCGPALPWHSPLGGTSKARWALSGWLLRIRTKKTHSVSSHAWLRPKRPARQAASASVTFQPEPRCPGQDPRLPQPPD